MKKAVRLTFSLNGLAPTRSAAVRYQSDTCAETLICCEEWPIAHHTTLYISGSMSEIRPSDHSQVGIRMIAPEAMVNTAMIAAVSAPKVTSGIEPSIGLFLLGDHQRRKEDRAADQRADREQDQAEIEVRLAPASADRR